MVKKIKNAKDVFAALKANGMVFYDENNDELILNDFRELANRNPIETEKKYPILYKFLFGVANENWRPYQYSILIDQLPKKIQELFGNANKLIPIQRVKDLKQIKEIVNYYIQFAENSNSKIVKAAYERNKDSINEGLAIIEKTINEINNITGFDCKRTQEDIKRIHTQMVEKNYIKADWDDFKAIFNKDTIINIKPIKWLIKAERGNTAGNGCQKTLREFLFQMLGKIDAEIERKIPYFFKDEKNNKMKINKFNKNDTCNIDFKKIINPDK